MITLKELHEYIKKDIDSWEIRRGEKLKPPYPADSPCYYCQFVHTAYQEIACDHCVQNPDSDIYRDI